ncbi:MAG: hypothetical protein GT589_06600 [Peptoclostridium sp.]|uniref:5' nucleotidase, NT5C type n=1 Tax=Peptoclostridium sp. TaxID=1904860 RepID=UPI00139DEF5D|nr:hypothetical protein [Peptoclostridium sp.]MZQ75816.1 hypothetical protein [Peptoclostridium sp.]
MKRLNICVDIDGTITDPYCYLEYFNSYFDKKIKPTDFSHHRLDIVYEVTRDEMTRFYMEEGRRMHLEATVQPDAREILWEMYKNHNIYFVTARYKEMEGTTLEWIQLNQLPPARLYSLGSHYKVDAAKELCCDVFLEDNPENAQQLAENGINVLLVDTNYNQELQMNRVTRVHSWNEIKGLVDMMAER